MVLVKEVSMKDILPFIFCLIYFIGFGQNPSNHQALRANFSYQLFVDSIPVLDYPYRHRTMKFAGDSLEIGCYHGKKVFLECSILIGNRVLHDYYFSEYKTESDEILLLYVVKRGTPAFDSSIYRALDDYCFFGQANVYYTSANHIFFTYQLAFGGIFRDLQNDSIWKEIADDLEVKIENQSPIVEEYIPASVWKDPRMTIEALKGEYHYVWKLANRVDAADTTSYSRGNNKLKIQSSNRITHIANVNSPSKDQYKDRGKWFTDGTFLYIQIKQRMGLQVFRLDENGFLRSIKGDYGLLKLE